MAVIPKRREESLKREEKEEVGGMSSRFAFWPKHVFALLLTHNSLHTTEIPAYTS
jgi:hypothetical protein